MRWNDDNGVRLFQVTVENGRVHTLREDAHMFSPRDSCSLEEYSSATGSGVQIKAEVKNELSQQAALEIDREVQRRRRTQAEENKN